MWHLALNFGAIIFEHFFLKMQKRTIEKLFYSVCINKIKTKLFPRYKMLTHPLRFLTDINDIGTCYDMSENNIIYFGNYVLFRPSYQRDKRGEGYNYSNAVLIDLDKSYIDISKMYKSLKNHNIDMTKQKHILYADYSIDGMYDDRWSKQLEDASVTNYITIPDTNNYYLSRIQYCGKQNTLLITHQNYLNPRTYTLIDLKTLSIIDSEFGNNKAQKYIKYTDVKFDCKFDYNCYSPYDIENEFRAISREYMDCNFNEIICMITQIKNELPPSKYTNIATGAIKSNGLLFIETGIWDIDWHLKNFGIGIIKQNMATCNISHDMQYVVYGYILHEIYSYLMQLNKLMQCISITAIYYLETLPYCNEPPFKDLKIPATYTEFCKSIRDI